jgi:hypothetical protein
MEKVNVKAKVSEQAPPERWFPSTITVGATCDPRDGKEKVAIVMGDKIVMITEEAALALGQGLIGFARMIYGHRMKKFGIDGIRRLRPEDESV